MTKNFPFILILICCILISFTLDFAQKSIKNPENEPEFKKEYEVDSFDFPVGKPDAKGYYNAQEFGVNNHLGEDWNGIGGGDTDFGDSIFAIANGQVTFAKDLKGGWGKVIRIKHKFKGKYYESLYAHCSVIKVKEGHWIKRGEFIGNIGDCHGKYKAHLHFELRDSLEMPIGGGYSSDKKGYIHPTKFINMN